MGSHYVCDLTPAQCWLERPPVSRRTTACLRRADSRRAGGFDTFTGDQAVRKRTKTLALPQWRMASMRPSPHQQRRHAGDGQHSGAGRPDSRPASGLHLPVRREDRLRA